MAEGSSSAIPTSSKPASPTPASSTPASPTPASTTPASTTPASTTPASSTPTPVSTTPASPTPAPSTPVSPAPASPTSSSPIRSSHRILRCFSNRYTVTEDEIKRFINVSTLVRNEKAKDIFRYFVTIGRRSDTSQALTALNCYELADKLLSEPSSRTDDNYDALKELMPSYRWESDFDDAIDAKKDDALNGYFEKLMEECKRTIETHHDFERYKRKLLDKLKKFNC